MEGVILNCCWQHDLLSWNHGCYNICIKHKHLFIVHSFADFEQVVSPVSVAHFSQYKLIRLLLRKLENLDFKIHDGDRPIRERDILMGHECLSFSVTDHCINVTSSFHKEGQTLKRDIQCSFLVGTDGAGSTVRKLAGIEMQGERDLQKLVSVHFMSKDLGRYLLKERPGMLFFIFNTEAIGVLVAHDLQQGEFVLQVSIDVISFANITYI